MSPVLARANLERSPLATLHVLANELGVDGFRRMRKPELVDAILARQPGAGENGDGPEGGGTGLDVPTLPDEAADDAVAERTDDEEAEDAVAERTDDEEAEDAVAERTDDEEAVPAARDDDGARADEEAEEEESRRGRRGRRGGRARRRGADLDEAQEAAAPEAGDEERVVEGTIELLANGSGFVRVSPPEPTDDDAYVSAAQVKRCELVSGDRVSGPVRPPRRSERYPSLVRVDRINGRPADEVAEGTRFDDLPVAFPEERFALAGEDPTVQAVEWATPFGRGSRVVLTGPARSGKSELVRRIAGALTGQDGIELIVVLAGVRPEEVAEWGESPTSVLTLAASVDAQGQALESALEQGRRVAARGGDAVVVVDTLTYLPAAAARRALAAARNVAGGGSLTVIATAAEPVGGETTLIALDPELTALRRFPNLDLAASGVLRPERLVGEAGAEAIANAYAEALEDRRRP